MIIRRGPSSGKALPLPVAVTSPLFHAKVAQSKRSAGVSQGNRTRAAKHRAAVLATMAKLRAECGL